MIKFESPLVWLPQQPRTKNPERARFGNHSISKTGDYLVSELEKLSAKECIISSNLRVKLVGGFYANQRTDDAGIVVYFKLKGQGKAMACDMWNKVEHNLWALYLSVRAIRGLERWGGSEFLDGLFTGFKALPETIAVAEKDYFQGIDNYDDLKFRYKKLSKEFHPDLGGDENEFKIMSKQYKKLEYSFGGKE